MRPPARNFENGCTSRMRLEESNGTARVVPVAFSAGTLAVAEPFRARAVPVDATGESARVVVVAFVDLGATAPGAAVALEPADDASASETAVVDRASLLPEPAGLAAGAPEVFEGAMIAGAAATDIAVGTAAPRVGTFAGAAEASVGMGGSREPSAIAAGEVAAALTETCAICELTAPGAAGAVGAADTGALAAARGFGRAGDTIGAGEAGLATSGCTTGGASS